MSDPHEIIGTVTTMPTEPPPDDAADVPRPKLTRKEQARLQRRAAYLRAKEQRANDPRLIALKEAMKKRRREAYQAAKERRKAAVAEKKSRQAEARFARTR